MRLVKVVGLVAALSLGGALAQDRTQTLIYGGD
jgi:peptide/nickel transport system substrate-binding protein